MEGSSDTPQGNVGKAMLTQVMGVAKAKRDLLDLAAIGLG